MSLSWQQPIRLNPVSYKVTIDAVKEFVDSQGITQTQVIATKVSVLSQDVHSYTIDELSPFTTYNVNVSAIPPDRSYRPPARLTVTTQMAAPLPMVGPEFYGVVNDAEITVILPQASEEFGPISHYMLVVIPEDQATINKQPDQFLVSDLIPNPKAGMPKQSDDEEKKRLQPYVAAKFLRRNVPYTFLLGDGKDYEGMANKRLEKSLRYRIFLRAIVDTPHKHLYTSSPFSDFLSLDMRKAPEGELPQRPNPNLPPDGHPSVPVPDPEQGNIIWIAIPLIGAVFVILIIGCVVVCVRRQRRPPKSTDHASVTKPLMAASEPIIAPTPNDPVELRRLNFQTPGMASHPPINLNELSIHIDSLKMSDNLKFSQEYESIETGQQFTWDHSNSDINKPKNRYANVIAYDHSRVILDPVPGVPGSDYINGNYCDGYRRRNAYIATQGPLPETFADFWRMCWEQKSSTIVMMTRLEERARIKCDQYWPTRGSDTYGVVSVMITDVQELATYCVRTFQLHRLGTSEHREVKQLQFTAWPDHGVPDHPAPFLQFLKRVRAINPVDSGPMIVHCSAGVGRTGAFIVIDSMLERLRYENTVDIYGHVTCLRAQRNYMVQTEDQYIFIHDSVLEAISCADTEVLARSLHGHLQTLMQHCSGRNGDTLSGQTAMHVEFKRLAAIRNTPGRFVSASLPVNKPKNRLVNVLPYESTRVCLPSLRGIDGSDYINASFIDGYRYRSAYIATQGPLMETTEDFWRMLWEHNSTIVVMLTKLQEMGQDKCHQYWPSERSIRYQYVVVEPVTEYNMPQYILREFKMTDARDGQSRTVRQFQFTDWPEEGVPKSGEGFIEFLGQVHKTKEQFGQEGPITVHCSAGVGRTGVFISLSIVLERMQYEGVVDVFQTVRILRTQRPAMVQTEDQYQFCYRAALEYLGSFDHYAGCD
nr:EOG090X01LO [Leptodora kindtii]